MFLAIITFTLTNISSIRRRMLSLVLMSLAFLVLPSILVLSSSFLAFQGEQRVWASTTVTTGNASSSFPSWSPDGSKIAFSSDRDGNYEIYVMNAHDGSNVIRLTDKSTPRAAANATTPLATIQ